MANMPDISLAPEVITQVGNFTISNATMAMAGTSLILIVLALWIRKGAGLVPTRRQMAFELILGFLMEKMEMAFGSEKRARKALPLMLTMFLIIVIANQFTLIPFIQSIVTEDGFSLFRAPTSDYSLPIVLTILILVLANGMAFFISPIRHIGSFIRLDALFKIRKLKDIPMACLQIVLGIMEIVGELAKFISLSTRLFGNIFAGEVIVGIVAGLMFYTQFFVPIPFLALSVLAGFVQAFVFVMLGSLYIGTSLKNVSPPADAA